MALGVLNNLSAIYAENNLNNTSNSLQTVLRQLSSGSKINSGADDSAGLSLVNGLQANQTALTQSKTNATEGVGLLEVADGALAQVTSLLDRAITLATEASNGTLDTAQESAANQEYTSILSEINNIGSTTTYNQQQVFTGNTIAIYTGDSSTAGSSIDNINIRTLSQSSIGDTGGVMSYSSGQNNVFLNLSTATANAAMSDTLNASGATTIDLKYLVKGATGASSTATTQISVGTGTSFSNTVGGLITALNNSGLGLNANFSTQAQSGVIGGGLETGIEITGGLVSAGVDPSSASTSGVLNPSGIPSSELLTQGQQIKIMQGGVQIGTTITISPAINTLSEVANAINGFSNQPVIASVITNGDGTQSLSLTDASSTGGALSVTTIAGSGAVAPVFSISTAAADAPVMSVASGQFTGTAVQNATNGSYTFGLSGTGNLGTDALSAGGSITLSNSLASGSITDTFVVGAGTDTATTFYTANHGDNSNSLANLATTIAAAANLNATAAVGSTGITVTSTTAAGSDNITSGANTLTNANNVLGLYSPTDGGSAVTGTATVTVLDSGGAAAQDDALTTGTHITLTQGANVMTFTAAAGQTYADLALAISSSNLGVNATWSSNTDGTAGHGGLVLTSKTNGVDTITVGGTSNLTDTIGGASIVKDGAATAAAPGSAGSPGSFSTAVLQLNNGGTITDATDTLTGSIALSLNGGATQTYIMGTGTNAGNTYYTGANTVASLLTAISITNTNSGMTATVAGVQAGTGAIYLQSNTVGAKPITVVGASTLADVTGKSENTNSNVLGRTGVAGVDSTYTVGLVGGAPANTTDVLATGGSISITNGSVTEAFTVGTGTAAATTYLAAGSTMSQLATAISGFGALGLTAQANTTGISLTSSAPQGTAIVVNSSTIADATLGHYQSDSLGTFASESDIVTGTMSFSVGGVAKAPITLNANSTVKDMIDQINLSSNALGVTANWVTTSNGFGNVVLTSKTEGTAGAITFPTAAIVDTTATATLSYSASNAYDTGMVSDATNVVYDSTTGQGTGALNQPAAATFISNAKSGSGVATTSYSDGAGQSLAGTNLLTQGNSQSALTALNTAITDAAAQDGYIGAQINTLNSVSQVMTTQQENVASAQNAIQATDYASATSNMSKYEILSQTGIAALAQANTVQQEVTKLLQ